MAAASGSAQMLNSAVGVRLPNSPPPMNEMPAMRAAMSGAERSARAMLVSGPVGTSHTPSWLRTVSMMKPDRIAAGRRARRRRQVGAVEPALAVHVTGVTWRGDQWSMGTGMHGDVDAEQIADDDGVLRRRFQRCVAGDRGDAEQVGVAGGDDHGDGVVVARVAIEDDGQAGSRWRHGSPQPATVTIRR